MVRSELRKFLHSFILFVLLPTCASIALIEWLAWRMGFTMSPASIAALQQKNPKVIWAGEGQYYAALKMARIELERPDIVFVGHSRCGQLRSGMFKPYVFHNACLTAWTFSQVRNMLDHITKSAQVKILAFDLDYFMLSEGFVNNWTTKAAMDLNWKMSNHFNGLIGFIRSFGRIPITMVRSIPVYLFSRAREPIDNMELIGVSAIHNQAGFRFDGSLLYDAKTRDAAPKHNTDMGHILAQVPRGTGTRISPKQVEELRALARLAAERGVMLVGIQLPIIKQAVDILDSGKDTLGYLASDAQIWKDLQGADTRAMLLDIGVHYFDMTRGIVADDSRNFIDPAHPAEIAALGAIVELLAVPEFRTLFPLMDRDKLNAEFDLARKRGLFFDVFRDRF